LRIEGEDTIPEEGSASYVAKASWSDGRTTDVTTETEWSESSPYCYFGTPTGTLYNENETGTSQEATITATYSYGDITKSDNMTVTLQDDVELTGLRIDGESTISEDGSASYVAIASWSDGSTTNVSAETEWSESSPYCHFGDPVGTLYNDNETGASQVATITATYSHGDITESDSMTVSLLDDVELTGLSIDGESTISEDGSASYVATASWSDGSTTDVTAETQWSESSPYCHFGDPVGTL
jgi:hypothetical protein